jgi:spermidine synthase
LGGTIAPRPGVSQGVRLRRLFRILYLLSGAAALLYEVVWLRLLTLSMGHTSRAVGILLAAFMGGLAVGAWTAGRSASSMTPARALRAYALLEAFIAACALILPALLAAVHPILRWVYAGDDAGSFEITIALLALVLLSVPTAAMGATYPVAVRWIEGSDRSNRSERSVAFDVGGLYAVNTVGAALGAGLTGFALLPLLGIRGTTIVGVLLNVAVAGGALLLAKRQPARERTRGDLELTVPDAGVARTRRNDGVARRLQPARRGDQPEAVPVTSRRVGPRIAATALGISGCVALVCQVTWTRTLAMVLGPTTYAFSAMVVAVITGLAVGSAVAAWRAPRSPVRAMTWLGFVMIAAAAAALAASIAIDRLPLVVASLVSRPDVTFGAVLVMQVALAIAIQLPMSIAFGAAFPLAIAAADSTPATVPRDASVVYATNTLGAIVGAIAASFVLIPTFGIQGSVRLAVIVAAVAGAVITWRAESGSPVRVAAMLGGAVTVALALAAPEWNVARLANGSYRYAPAFAAGDIETGLEAGRLVYYREGAAGTVSVRDVPGARSLAIDGKVDASNAGDMLTQKLLAHLPLLLHPNPRRVCVIGLGSGVTLGASLTHPVERVDVVEISPEVVEASSFFAAENHNALNDPRTELIIGDGRSHLLLSTEQYDVIISEPSNPWMTGVATLFTREFFLAARARLAPGGILMQWAHTYSISDADLRSIVATFASVFPEGSAWLVAESDLLLVGATGPIVALDDGISAAWSRPGVATDLAEAAVRDPFSVLSLYVAGGGELQNYAGDALVQTDDRLLLEYSAPRTIYGFFQRANVERLRDVERSARQPQAVARARAEATPAEWRNRGLMQLRAGAVDLAYADLRNAVMGAPADAEALQGLARAAARSGRLEGTERLLSEIGTVPALVELSFLRAVLGRVDEAIGAARDAVVRNPTDRSALVQLASMYADAGDEEGLVRLIELVEQARVDRAVLLYCQMRLAYLRGDFQEAAQLGEALAELDPVDAKVHNLLGSAYAALGQYDRARQALEASLQITPTDPGVLVNLGMVALRASDPVLASERFSEALFLSPTHAGALDGLAEAYDRQGNRDRAVEVRARTPKSVIP